MLTVLKRWLTSLFFRLIANWFGVDHRYIRQAFHYLAQLDMDEKQVVGDMMLFGMGNHVEIYGKEGRFTMNENDRGEIFIHEYKEKEDYVSQGDLNFRPKSHWKEIYRSSRHVTEPLAVHRATAMMRRLYGQGESNAV